MRPARADDFRLPELRFVPVGSLIPHERHDLQRMAPLVERFREQAVLKNPPIVTPIGNGDGAGRHGDGETRYMVLDGANRSTAAREAGFPHMVVQIARYEEPWVQLTTWHHALSATLIDVVAGACEKVGGLTCHEEPLMHARAELSRRQALAYAVHGDGSVLAFRGGHSLEERNQRLNAIVETYRGQRFYRMTTESYEVARERHPDVTALIVFPHFAPAEVLELASRGEKLPAGITRHLIRWRALRVNVPLERLADPKPSLEAKNAWLGEWIETKFNDRHVRFYEESTVLFDE